MPTRPMRVLHLIDAYDPQAAGPTFALMAASQGRLGGVEQTFALLGPASSAQAAHAAGLTDVLTVNCPLRRPILARAGLRRRLRSIAQPEIPFDLIHAWSPGSFSLAAVAFRRVPRLLTVTCPLDARSVQWLRVLTAESPGRSAFLPISATLRRSLLTGGIAEDQAALLRPGIDQGRIVARARPALRAAWGLPESTRRARSIPIHPPARRRPTEPDRPPSDSSSSPVVVLPVADPIRRLDARLLLLSVGLAGEMRPSTGPGLAFLCHPDQPGLGDARRVLRELGSRVRIIQDARVDRPWEVAPGCDLALAAGPDAGGLSLIWAMAGDLPIIGEARYAVSEIVEDRHSALLARPDEPRRLASRLDDLINDDQLQWKLRDTARHEAFSFFSRQRYVTALGGVYRQMAADEPIDIPPMEPTGGLRFAGRA